MTGDFPQELRVPSLGRFVFILLLVVLTTLVRQIYLYGLPTPFEANLEKYEWLKLQELKIQAEWPLSESEIRAVLPNLIGKNLLALDPRLLKEKIATRPWVDSVVIKKEFPNRLSLYVDAKKPRAISLFQGTPYFVDKDGNRIDRVSRELMKNLDLPFVTLGPNLFQWKPETVFSLCEKLKKILGPKTSLSQVVLGTYPYLKIFLTKPRIEVVLNAETWESQVPYLTTLLSNPPGQIGQLKKINLLFPKKAVVTTTLSK